jgi:23S rRNA (cytidine1920-2'-O)/16S rRNA (cytidine1409-2'-O)-methyltransferase
MTAGIRQGSRMNLQSNPSGRIRLDQLLVERGLFSTRSRARDAVMRGGVTVDGRAVAKPGEQVSASASIEVDDPARSYVSRAALKLIAGLDHFGFDVMDRLALDLGASTGGFTQVLLERGARHVVAIDVGHDQFDASLRDDPRITCIEGLNARDLSLANLGGSMPEVIVSDLSFISLKLALPPALQLAAAGAVGLFLVKPQFEAGREAIGKGGLLKDPAGGPRVAEALRQWLDEQAGWRAIGIAPSPIQGGDGNHEFLLGGIKDR